MMNIQDNITVDTDHLGLRDATERVLHQLTRLFGTRRGAVEQPQSQIIAAVTPARVIDIGTPAALRSLAANAPARVEQRAETLHAEEELRQKQRVKTLLQTHLNDTIWNELLSHVRPAAERGESQLLLLRFPSDLCSDGGRRIRIGGEGWRETLQGEAAELRDRWRRDLSEGGFGLAASTLEYHGDMPGDIGLFLTWHG